MDDSQAGKLAVPNIAEAASERVVDTSGRELISGAWDPRSLLLTGIFSILLLCAVYLARDVVFPMMLAFILNLLLQPVMRLLTRIGFPRPIAALLTLCSFIAMLSAIAFGLAG